VVQRGDAGDGVIDSPAAASALAEDLVVFEAGDGVFGDRAASSESTVVPVFDLDSSAAGAR
jgi:hypothetical protein